jgi:CheY-like chemotaxis protein
MTVKTAVFNEETKIDECLEFVKTMLRKDANCIAILDYSTVKILFEDPAQRDLATSILCVGSFDEQVLAVHNAIVEVHRFVLSPMKFSALYNKIETLLSKPRERASVTDKKPLESKPLPESFDLPLAMSQQQQRADEAKNATPKITVASTDSRSVQPMAGITEVNEETPVKKVPMLQPLDEGKTEPKMNILIVEDHIVNQKVVCAMLNKVLSGNFTFKIANNGKEGFDAATEPGAQYDLTLMDIQMPVMDGLSATKMIRDWEQTQPGRRPSYICAVTAHASQTDRNDCYDVGMNRYMTKPLNLSSMKEIIADWRKWDAEGESSMKKEEQVVETS